MGREKQKPRRLGMIYKRKMTCKDGTVTESSNWYIKYHRDGVPYKARKKHLSGFFGGIQKHEDIGLKC